ncbi:hypothetical protein BDDG_12608 [Blastomyces dermatitidis ATCC 18188]|uniref:Derlin n=1 Tax=Ajellomyces dermatitidis (strain ATCC 18188 / CBS 674.68) TaxID=653446 RepID=A0A0J9ESK7_AJEDA|nr:hypothetical protein BDDG_12608 [Blastomyces dermatitidis ATCC 18188]
MLASPCKRPSISALLPRIIHSQSRRTLSSSALRTQLDQLPQRRLPLFYDYLTPQQSHLLNLSLTGFVPTTATANNAQLPPTSATTTTSTLPSSALNPPPMPAGHHLVYFPPQVPTSQLLPDGTDILHYPGPPFNRRMWAGGWVRWRSNNNNNNNINNNNNNVNDHNAAKAPGHKPLLLDGQRAACMEGIRDVSVKGREGEEKVFVSVERRVAVVGEGEDEAVIKRRVWTEDEGEWGDAVVVERRNLVFMRDRDGVVDGAGKDGGFRKVVKAPTNPDFSHLLIPSRSLLFRFSALTFNAHSIHLDPSYARDVEGYPDVLVHGPLTLTLILTAFQNHISDISAGQAVIGSIEYRNLAPLFVEREMRICAKQKGNGGSAGAGPWDIWVEGPEGGLTVKGTVHARQFYIEGCPQNAQEAFSTGRRIEGKFKLPETAVGKLNKMDVFWSAPPVIRTITAAAFIESLLVYGGLLSPVRIFYHHSFIFKIFPEVWRLVTSFLLTDSDLNFIFDLYFMYKYGSGLERDSPRFSIPGDFFTYVVFVGTVILFTAGGLVGAGIFIQALIIAFMYTHGQANAGKKENFYVVQIPVEMLPWATLALRLVIRGPHAAWTAACGLVAAHLYEFLTRIYPTYGRGRQFIWTPVFVKRWFGAHHINQTHRAYGVAYHPGDRETREAAKASGSGSGWFSSDSWSGRGVGRRLG